jgi:hypothetical protein
MATPLAGKIRKPVGKRIRKSLPDGKSYYRKNHIFLCPRHKARGQRVSIENNVPCGVRTSSTYMNDYIIKTLYVKLNRNIDLTASEIRFVSRFHAAIRD